MYLQRSTRIDITFIVCQLAQFCIDPTIQHWNAVIRIFRYLKGTLSYCIRFGSYGRLEVRLYRFVDLDYASDPKD